MTTSTNDDQRSDIHVSVVPGTEEVEGVLNGDLGFIQTRSISGESL